MDTKALADWPLKRLTKDCPTCTRWGWTGKFCICISPTQPTAVPTNPTADKERPQPNEAARLVNSRFLDSDYQGKDWEAVRKCLIADIEALLQAEFKRGEKAGEAKADATEAYEAIHTWLTNLLDNSDDRMRHLIKEKIEHLTTALDSVEER